MKYNIDRLGARDNQSNKKSIIKQAELMFKGFRKNREKSKGLMDALLAVILF
jgi:hypothetical protein